MARKLSARVTYENPTSGLRTIELSHEAWFAVASWLETQGHEDAASVPRRYRVNARGQVTFKCGVGYAVIDADLLGGSGDGLTESRFQSDTDSFIFVH